MGGEGAVTAGWTRLPYDMLARIPACITNSVSEVNRVVLDYTSKPPGCHRVGVGVLNVLSYLFLRGKVLGNVVVRGDVSDGESCRWF